MREWRFLRVLGLVAAGMLPGMAAAQSYADRNLSLPQGNADTRRPIVIVSPVTPAAPPPVTPTGPHNGPTAAYASDVAGADIRAKNTDYITQFQVVGQVPPGSTISQVSWRYGLARKPAGFEAWLCWQDAGTCWSVTEANAGNTDFFNGRDATRPFQLYYRVKGSGPLIEGPVKGEINQVIVNFRVPG
ncbi:MAG: flagellar protein FlhE [Herbaspirillum sp.]|nr:flagellar protein FlhE [Herbaspirillum sp.]